MPSSAQSSLVVRTARNNRHVRSACAGCRRRHIKCDDLQPACSACAAKGRKCTRTADEDGRSARRGGSKGQEQQRVYITQLEARIAALETQLGSAESQAAPALYSQTRSPPSATEQPSLGAPGLFNQSGNAYPTHPHVPIPELAQQAQGSTFASAAPTFPQTLSGTAQMYPTQANVAYTTNVSTNATPFDFTADTSYWAIQDGGMSGFF